jgi:hypothetical protein
MWIVDKSDKSDPMRVRLEQHVDVTRSDSTFPSVILDLSQSGSELYPWH